MWKRKKDLGTITVLALFPKLLIGFLAPMLALTPMVQSLLKVSSSQPLIGVQIDLSINVVIIAVVWVISLLVVLWDDYKSPLDCFLASIGCPGALYAGLAAIQLPK